MSPFIGKKNPGRNLSKTYEHDLTSVSFTQ